MSTGRYECLQKDIKIEVFEDDADWYVMAYRLPYSASFYDSLQDSKEQAFEEVLGVFSIEVSEFQQVTE